MNKPVSQLKQLLTLQGVPALCVLTLGAAVPDGDWVSIGGRVYECDDQAAETITAGHVRVPVFNGYANATLGFSDSLNVANGNTVTVGTKVYTFQTVLTNVDGHVKIGGTIERSIYNLVAAMNVGNTGLYEPPTNYGALNDVGEGPGVAYAAATTKNAADIEAGYGGDFELTVSHRPGGAGGNTIALAATLAGNGAWAEGAFLDPVADPSAAQFGVALAAALNSDPDGPAFAEVVSATEVIVWSRCLGNVCPLCESGFTSDLNNWQDGALYGGLAGRDTLNPVVGVQRVVNGSESNEARLHFVFGFPPSGALVQVWDVGGAVLAFNGTVTITGRRVTVNATGGNVSLDEGRSVQVLAFR